MKILSSSQNPFAVDELILYETVVAYLAHKQARFSQALANSRNLDWHILQRAHELPSADTRTVRGLLEDASDTSPGERLHKILLLEGGNEATNHLARLINLETEYSALLDLTIKGEVTIEVYETWIHNHRQEMVGSALRVCRVASLAVNHMFGIRAEPSDKV